MGWLNDRRNRQRREARKRELAAARATGQCVRVRQGEVRDLVAERLPAALGDFERVRENRFVAPAVREGEWRVLEVAAYKGMSYGLHWGISLPYLPDDRGRRHRTAKAAQLDLFERGEARASYWFGEDPRDEPLVWYVLPEIDAMVAEAAARARAFRARTETPSGVVEEARRRIAAPDWKWRQEEIAALAAQQT